MEVDCGDSYDYHAHRHDAYLEVDLRGHAVVVLEGFPIGLVVCPSSMVVVEQGQVHQVPSTYI